MVSTVNWSASKLHFVICIALHWMLSVRLKCTEYASLVTVVHRCQLKPQWLSVGVGVWNAAGYAVVVQATKKTFVGFAGVAVTLTDSSLGS